MSVGLPSDEVAEDYKNSLEDLTINSRYEISNLTVIAKENTEHAMAISRVLENHIKSTPPDRKLPALYVLDSVVKNVGTPYTLFLGRNLYTIFMNAYSLVNNQVRRKLDEMLKTWKEPVPGSLDPRPVFPAETIRPIENALIKARTAAVQAQQQQQSRAQQEMMARTRPMATPNPQWRSTPTPPQARGPFYPPPQQMYGQQSIPNGNYQARPQYPQTPNYSPPQPTTNYQQPYPQPQTYNQYQNPTNNFDPIHQDVEKLISAARSEFSSNVNDDSLRIRLQALLALQAALKSQSLSPQDLQAARNEVSRLFAEVYGPSGPAISAPPLTPAPTAFVPPPQDLPQQKPAQVTAPQISDVQSLLSSRNLADIIAKAQQTSATPPISQAPLSQAPPPPQISSTPSLSANLGDMLASLKAKGILSGASITPVNGSHGYAPPPATTQTPPLLPGGFPRPSLINDAEVTSTSLKRPRTHLVSTLYEARLNQCSTCGRRFLATPEGKEKKARHLDWHFRTNQRLADSAKRGQNRSWYVDELEWIKSRDNPEDAPLTDGSSDAVVKAALAASLAAADPKNKYIPVPSDPTLANQPCPICQEQFDTVWNDEVQDFVWMDAMKSGTRVYHASCHSEVKKEGGTTPLRINTPDSVLGKRKAIGDYGAGNAKAVKA